MATARVAAPEGSCNWTCGGERRWGWGERGSVLLTQVKKGVRVALRESLENKNEARGKKERLREGSEEIHLYVHTYAHI